MCVLPLEDNTLKAQMLFPWYERGICFFFFFIYAIYSNQLLNVFMRYATHHGQFIERSPLQGKKNLNESHFSFYN